MVSTFWAFVVLFPVFATGGGDAVGWYHFSMSNVLQSDWRIWPPTIFIYAFSAFTLWTMKQEYTHFLAQRMEFLCGRLREVHPQQQYSIMVEVIPKELRSDKALYDYFNALYPGKIHSACVVLNLPDLEAESLRRQRKVRRLEKSLARFEASGFRPRHIVGRPRIMCCGIESEMNYLCHMCCNNFYQSRKPVWDEFSQQPPEKGDLVDSIAYYTLEVEECNDHMVKEQRKKKEMAEIGNKDLADSATWIDRMMSIASAAASSVMGPIDGEQGSASLPEETAPPRKYVVRYGAMEGGLKRSDSSTLLTTISEDSVSRPNRQPYLPIAPRESTTVFNNNSENGASLSGLDVNGENYNGIDINTNQAGPEPRRKLFPDLVRSVMGLPGQRSNLDDDITAGNWQQMQEDLLDPNLLWDGEECDEDMDKDRGWCMVIIGRLGWDFLYSFLQSASSRLDLMFDSVLGTTMSSTGFVTFTDLASVTSAASAPLSYAPEVLQCAIAPEPRDIIWTNAHCDRRVCKERESIASFLVGFGALLWSVPLAFIQAMATADSLAKIPGMQWILVNASVANFVNGYLPVVALLTLILVLPFAFELVATRYEHRKTQSDVQHSIFVRYFYYQIANIYVSVTAGSIFISLQQILAHPYDVFRILGSKLPTVAGYFISLLLTKILAGLPMVLLRIGALSRMIFLKLFFKEENLTQRELDEVYRELPIMYGWEYPSQLLVIMICFTYAAISPMILPFGAIYFFFALVVYKKQAMFVYTPTFESGGSLFHSACDRTLMGLILGQLTFLGYCLIRGGKIQPILLVPLPFITVQTMRYFQKHYSDPGRFLSLEMARKIDKDPPVHISEFNRDAYRQPVLAEGVAAPKTYRRATRAPIAEYGAPAILHRASEESRSSNTGPKSFSAPAGDKID